LGAPNDGQNLAVGAGYFARVKFMKTAGAVIDPSMSLDLVGETVIG
jgi:hypothetical protein